MQDQELEQEAFSEAELPETPDRVDGRGQFAKKVKAVGEQVDGFEVRLRHIEELVEGIHAKLDKAGMLDPEDIEFLWENFSAMTEVVSALRRVNGFPPLAEFEGTRLRRRKKEHEDG